MLIPICINAKNEEKVIGDSIQSLFKTVKYAEKKSEFQFEIYVYLDDSTDKTLEVCKSFEQVKVVEVSGGLVEAQRSFALRFYDSGFLVFSDADIIHDEDSLFNICVEMKNEKTMLAYPEKKPLRPKRKSLLAKSLYEYNKNNGYQSNRKYFNGQFFAIRNWHIPAKNELEYQHSENNNYLCLEEGIRCDDIYLSMIIIKKYGTESIKLVQSSIYYRPPETFKGMYRKYQRMKLEIERLGYFFPDTDQLQKKCTKRRLKYRTLFKYGGFRIFLYCYFILCLRTCDVILKMNKIYYKFWAKSKYKTWQPVEETKDSLSD